MERKRLIAWVEIPSADFERAVKFYGSVLNIEPEVFSCGNGEFMACLPGGEGAIVKTAYTKPSADGSVVSFTTDSIDAAIARAEEFGATVVVPKTKIEVEGHGYFAVLFDSEGNKFGLYE